MNSVNVITSSSTGNFYNTSEYLKSVKVSSDEAAKLKGCYYNDTYQRLCFKETSNFLFGRGLRVTKISSKSEEPTDTLQAIINKQWTPFAKEVLLDKFIYGYSVYSISTVETLILTKKSSKKMKIPVRVDRSHYDLIIHTNHDYTITYEIVKKHMFGTQQQYNQSLEQDNEIQTQPLYITFMTGHSPDQLTGEHRSYVSEIYPEYIKKNMMEDWNYRAIQQISHPPILIQRDMEMLEKYNPASTIVNDYVVATNRGEIIKNPNILKTSAPLNIISELQSIEVSTQTKPPRGELDLMSEEYTTNGKRRMLTHSHTPEDNIHYIPIGYKMATPQPQLPGEIKDFHILIEKYRELVFATYQIPLALVFPLISGKSSSDKGVHLDDNDKQRFTRTLRDRQEDIIKLMAHIYMLIFNISELDVNIDLPLVANATLSQLFNLVDQDVIQSVHGKELILDATGIDLTLLFEGKNNLTRPRIGGNENTIDKMIKARVDNIIADTELKEAQVKQTLSQAGKQTAEKGKLKAETEAIESGEMNAGGGGGFN